MKVEGVTYYPFLVTFRMADGRRRRWRRWSPGWPFIAEEVRRELTARFDPGDVLPNIHIRPIGA